MLPIALAAVLCAAPSSAAPVDTERIQAADRLAERAQLALDGVLGPGRSQVHVEVQGERSELTSESEVLLPLDRTAASAAVSSSRAVDLPGYVKDRLPEAAKAAAAPARPGAAPQTYQKEHEVSLKQSGFQVRSIQATVLLDSSLPDGPVRDAAQLLPDVLHLDTARGDALTVLRAPLRPAWKAAFSTPGDWRSAALAAGGGLVALIAALIVCGGLVRGGRALGRELATRAPPAPVPYPLPPAPLFDPLPELSSGAAGLLGASAPAPAGVALLGRRFDFLIGKETELTARALAREKPEDLAVFFSHLSDAIPELASRLFGQLSGAAQADVSEALLKMSVADPERLGALEERLRESVENGVLGPQALGRLLSRVPGEARAGVMERLAARDARAAEEVERNVFAFEDLERLSPESLARLVAAVPADTWGCALRGASAGLIERVLEGLASGARERVRDAVSAPQPREKVAEERSRALDALASLIAKGEAALGRSRPGGDLV